MIQVGTVEFGAKVEAVVADFGFYGSAAHGVEKGGWECI